MLNYSEVQQSIINWFLLNKRDLPWRKDRTWYNVWISEIMLQQTQVDQVKNYYHKFMIEFPYIQVLAKADLQKVLKLWEGLGYYSRARNLHKTAQIIVNHYNGKFPSTKSDIIKLPGIGEYTANAILSLVFHKPYCVVDGVTKTLQRIKSKTEKLMPSRDSANFNEAMMEFGALICLPKNPNCKNCPTNEYCQAFKDNLTSVIPFKSKNAAKPLITVIIQIVKKKNKYYIVKRKDQGLLGGYWEFPYRNLENDDEVELYSIKTKFESIKHTYTHFNLLMYPVLIKKSELQVNKKLYVKNKWVTLEDVKNLPIHKAMQKVLKIITNN